MEEKWTRVVIHDPHGNVIADRPLSPEGAAEQVSQHNADQSAHPYIQEAITGLRTQVERRLVGAKVTFNDGHTEDVELGYNDQGEVILLLPKETFGKIDGVKVNGEELPVDENGKVDIPIPQSVTDLEDAEDYATKEDAQAMVDEAKVTGATLDYQEDGGSPSATVDFSEGSLGFTLKNMKMKFSELSPEERALLKGEQGIQGIPGQSVIVGEGDLPLENYVSQADDKAITPKAVGSAINMIGLDKVAVDTSSSRTFSAWLSTSSWSSSTGTTANRRGKLILVNPGEKYVLEYNGVGTNYSVMQTPSVSGTAEFATGFSRQSVNESNPSAEITIPDDGAYIYVLIQNDNEENCEPNIYKIRSKEYGEDGMAPVTQDTVRQMALVEQGYKEVEQGYREVAAYIGSNTDDAIWTTPWQAYAARRSRILPITQGIYELENISEVNAYYAVLASGDVEIGQTVDFARGCTRKTVIAGEKVRIEAPEDATHICLSSYMEFGAVRWSLIKKISSIFEEEIGYNTEKAMSQKAVTLSLNKEAIPIDLSLFPETTAALYNTTWMNVTTRKSVFIPVEEGTCVRMFFPKATNYAILTSNEWARTGNLPFAEGVKSRETGAIGETHLRKMPKGAKYICMMTYISEYRNPQVEYLSIGYYNTLMEKSRLATSLMQDAKVISDKSYVYAFLPQIMHVDNGLVTIFAGNKYTTDGDATVNSNKMVKADYDIMTGDVVNEEMPEEVLFVDQNGDALQNVTRSYNNCVFAPYGGDIAKCGVLGDGSTHEISIGYKHHFTDTTMTRCKLAYDNGTVHEVEFTMSNYRQMLVDMGYMDTLVEFEYFSTNLTDLCKADGKFYMVYCGHSTKGENAPLPLILLESTDFATWNVVAMLGENMHYGGEIRSVVKGGKVYVIYRMFPEYGTQSAVTNGYGLGIYSIDGTALCEKKVNAGIQSLPMCFEINGNVWFGHNEIPAIGGSPSVNTYPYARQQMAFYRATSDDDIKYEFSIKNPTGFNYATTVTVRTSHSGNEVANLDRLYMAFSEDRRNLNYRQINNCSLVNMTSIFGQ